MELAEVETRVHELEYDNRKLKERNSELLLQAETAEAHRFQVLEELEDLKKEIDYLRADVMSDKDNNKRLTELVENQKQQLEANEHELERSRSVIQKLKAEGSKVTAAAHKEGAEGSKETIEFLKEENERLRKENFNRLELEDTLAQYREENKELMNLLKDKEQLAEAIKDLLTENERYRKEHEELMELLEGAKKSALELREKLDESVMERGPISFKDDKERELWEYLCTHEDEVKAYVGSKIKSADGAATESKPADSDWTKNLKPRGSLPHDSYDKIANAHNKYNSFAARSRTVSGTWDKITDREETKYLMGVLDNKIDAATNRMSDMKHIVEESKVKEEVLDALSKKLLAAEDKLRGKQNEIDKLRESLLQGFQMSNPLNLKEGWLTKKGNILPTWKKHFFALSGVDSKFYYAKSASDKFLGMINLKFAFIQKDENKRSGKDWCFFINTHEDKRIFYLHADSEEEMNSWFDAIQKRIEQLSFA